jgi:asparagine synthase (glutamine-hydrolysing)
MCGIFSIIECKQQDSKEVVTNAFNKGQSRGPENSHLYFDNTYNSYIGFHRLAINGLDSSSNQPIKIDDCILICNGEIYNYKYLYEQMKNVTPTTHSDCEVIIHMYKKYGIDHTLRMLDGVFAFVLFTKEGIFIARDPFGVRPLYYYQSNNGLYVASELKCLSDFSRQFPPGSLLTYPENSIKKWFIPAVPSSYINMSRHLYEKNIYEMLDRAVYKRCITTERPIACLLSGGLDSSLIASLVKKYVKTLETYSIGLEGAEDLRYAKMVADYIGSKHTEIIVTVEEMINAIPEVIYAIESYDVTTVRASLGNYLIGKYIKANSDAKVIFNGDGSDELTGGYLYMQECPDDIEFDKETIRLLNDIHMYDVLRSDKCISSHGLEPRTPFLDRAFVNYYLSIPASIRRQKGQIEKYLLRCSMETENLLPKEVLWRKKEAFSDGVSSKGRSLYQIIQEYIYENHFIDGLTLIDAEKKYYKDIFIRHFGSNNLSVVPYYWMPKYIESNDPSARTLKTYKLE